MAMAEAVESAHTNLTPVPIVDKIMELRLVAGPHPLGLMLPLTFDERFPKNVGVALSITAIPFVDWVSGPPGAA